MLAFFRGAIKTGYVDELKLKEELNSAMSDPHFEWLKLAIEQKFIVYDAEKETNERVRDRFKSFVWNVLYPSDNPSLE